MCCLSRILAELYIDYPELAVSHWLAPHEATVVELTVARPGRIGFACGMNMIHGTLLVEGDPPAEVPVAPTASSTSPAGAAPDGQEDAEVAARRAEVRDLTRRLIVGAVFTVPVLVAVMADSFFSAAWVPDALLDGWVQLALIAPVMVWVGRPIHRTGWLALAHRACALNPTIADH